MSLGTRLAGQGQIIDGYGPAGLLERALAAPFTEHDATRAIRACDKCSSPHSVHAQGCSLVTQIHGPAKCKRPSLLCEIPETVRTDFDLSAMLGQRSTVQIIMCEECNTIIDIQI